MRCHAATVSAAGYHLVTRHRDVHPRATFAHVQHSTGNQAPHRQASAMKTIMPVILALIPLAAVMGACAVCP
jgi:hypothetical protein